MLNLCDSTCFIVWFVEFLWTWPERRSRHCFGWTGLAQDSRDQDGGWAQGEALPLLRRRDRLRQSMNSETQ